MTDHGIVWESGDDGLRKRRDMGLAVFETTEARTAAVEWLTFLGYRYFTTYRDAQGAGLSYAWRCGTPMRPAARERLPSVQRARRNERARQRFAAHIYKPPSYDPVH